jgi:hypothetical protein
MSTNKNTAPSEAALLVEYEAAQSSAQHHDVLVWMVTNALWAMSFVMFGIALSVLDNPATKTGSIKVLLSFLCCIGIAMLVFAWYSSLQFANIRNQKYSRCKIIEAQLGLKQHTDLEHPQHSQRDLYAGIFFLLICAWIWLLVVVWVNT